MKFSTKLAALFSMILLSIFAIIGYLGYTSSTGILEDQIRDKLEDHAFHTMDKIDRMLFERYVDMRILAADPIVRTRSSTPQQITDRLSEYQAEYKLYASLSFFDPNRIRIADTSGKDIGKQHSFTEYWPGIKEGRDFVMVVTESSSLKKVVFYFATVVKDKGGNPFGVVVSRMPVEILYEIAERTFALEDKQIPKVELLDKEGLILYSSYNIQGILKKKSDDWEYIKGLISKGKNVGSARHSYLGEEEITAFAMERGYQDFKGNDWILVICTPTAVALVPVAEQNKMFMIAFPIIGLLSLLSAFLFSRTITRSLIALNDAAKEFGRGNFDRNIDVTSRDEIGQLAQSFNQMSAELKKCIADIKESNERLQIEVTERKRAENAILENERYLQSLLESMHTGVFVIDAETHTITYANSFAAEMIGADKNDLIGCVCHKFVCPAELKKCPVTDLGQTIDVSERVLISKTGKKIPILKSVMIVGYKGKNYLIENFISIEDRKRAEEALHKSEKKLRDVTLSLAEGIIVLDERGCITFMNPAAEQLLGWTEAELINKNAHDIIHNRKADRTPLPFEDCPIHNVIKSGDRFFSEEQVFKRKDGTLFPALVLSSPIIENGKIVASVTAFQDITERRMAEEQIKKQSAELKKLNNELSVLYEEMKVLSLCDPLTGLSNRRLMDVALEKTFARAKRYGRPFSVIMLDIDHFKQYNDIYGHPEGDKMLVEIAIRIL